MVDTAEPRIPCLLSTKFKGSAYLALYLTLDISFLYFRDISEVEFLLHIEIVFICKYNFLSYHQPKQIN